MDIEKVIINKPGLLFIIITLFLLASSWLSYHVWIAEEKITDWKMEVVGQDNRPQAGVATDIHIFLEDEFGEPITNANVSLILDMPDMVHYIEKTMHHVENGLFETEVVLSMGGTWIGWLEAKVGNKVYINQFLLEANGPLVSKEHRDPKDYLHLEQPLPSWVRIQFE